MTVWCAVLLFWTSQSVQTSEKKLRELQNAVFNEKEYIRVLTSEWDYLNRPERLEYLAQEYLKGENNQLASIPRYKEGEEFETFLSPSIPKPKPSNLLNYASMKPDGAYSQKDSLVSQSYQDQFTDLIGALSLEETP
ncbi:MAG: hypothetical protein AAF549_08310 [Pseudomonadota bacterium]